MASTTLKAVSAAAAAGQSQPPATPKSPVVEALMAAQSKMKSVLPAHITPEKMARLALNEMRLNDKLRQAAQRNPESFVSSVMLASQLGLEIGGAKGHGYLVPYGSEVKFMPGYRGLIDLARRTGQVSSISVHIVFEKDEFDMVLGIAEKISHKPYLEGDRGKPRLVYAVAHFTDGSHHFDWMSMDEVERIRRISKGANSGPWVDHYGEMVRKTMVRRLAKYLPMSSDRLESAVRVSDAVDTGRSVVIDGDMHFVEEPAGALSAPEDPFAPAAAAATPTDRPDPNTESDAHDQPQRGDDKEHPVAVTYSRLAERVNRAADREAAELVLDESRALPGQQQSELKAIFDERFPAEG